VNYDDINYNIRWQCWYSTATVLQVSSLQQFGGTNGRLRNSWKAHFSRLFHFKSRKLQFLLLTRWLINAVIELILINVS
jgi:hypothetical protein